MTLSCLSPPATHSRVRSVYLCRTKHVLCSLAAWPQLQTHGLSKALHSHRVHA